MAATYAKNWKLLGKMTAEDPLSQPQTGEA